MTPVSVHFRGYRVWELPPNNQEIAALEMLRIDQGGRHSINDLLLEAEAAGFETRDVESLREHYPLTLRRWLTLLDKRHEDVVRVAGEPTYRV